MWHKIAAFIIKFRIALLVILLAVTGVLGYFAAQVKLSYDFVGAVPTDNQKYIEYQQFRKDFGEDGNLLVIGLQTKDFFDPVFFNDYTVLAKAIARVPAVENVLSIPGAITLIKDTLTEKLKSSPLIIDSPVHDVADFKAKFNNLPIYKSLLYNPDSSSYLMAVRVDKEVLNSKARAELINSILALGDEFGNKHHVAMHYSGLPLIRTQMALRVQSEMKLFLIFSFLLTAVILILFFKSVTAVISSMFVVAIGVIWSIGTIVLLGYKITLLTALIPPLVVVIGIPNCVYLLNRYHYEYNKHPSKIRSLLRMVDRMGVVTFFTNLTAAIGFGVFYFTKSALLKEFGLVAGINILGLFFISLIFIPAFFSILPPPNVRHTSYMDSQLINKMLTKVTNWVFSHRKTIYTFTIVICVFSAIGVSRLRSNAYIVDDLPKSDKVSLDLKFFENNFKGVMPLEIIIDTRKRNGALNFEFFNKMDQLTGFLQHFQEIGHPLAVTEGIKFVNQAYFGGDSTEFSIPSGSLQGLFIMPYLRTNKGENTSIFSKLLHSFIDSNKQKARISVSIADVGSRRLPILLDSIRPQTLKLFDTAKYNVTFTGTSITFLEGSKFIVNSLRDSLILAFFIIFGCMILLFRSWQILVISIIVNIVPLLITAGIMGWVGIRIKPSTVLVFSVALGITIDVTIRFLVNFKQELMLLDTSIPETVHRTIRDTGLSIIYTSLILTAGFAVFMLSHFDGTKSLGYLTSLTLMLAMLTNLILLPALLLWMNKRIEKKNTAISFLISDDKDDVIKIND